MANLLSENEIIEFENQQYLNPQVALDESTAFIDNLRNVQDRNNAEINAQTRNLGTEVPSNLGGLVGGEGYFTSRYQTPQSVSVAANLRATAQAQALNDVLQNELSAQKQRYNNAYKAARQRAMRSGGGGGGGNPGGNPSGDPDNIEQTTTTYEVGDIQTEGIAKSIYDRRFLEYIRQGMSAEEAEVATKQSMGLSPSVQSNLQKKKSPIRGKANDYVYTLPNGNTVLVDEDSYKLVNAGDKYFLQDLKTKSLTRVGG